MSQFTDYAKEYIIEHFIEEDFFDEVRKESDESYIEDIKNENATDTEKFSSRLEEEMHEANCNSEEEYLEYLYEDEDSVSWFIEMFGNDEFKEVVRKHDLIDWEKVIEWVQEIDGRGCLAYYDGEELELDNGYYAYRID